MIRIKPSRKKTNSQKKIAKIPEHLKEIEYIEIHKRAEIIPSYRNCLPDKISHSIILESTDDTGVIDRKVFDPNQKRWRPWLLEHQNLEKKIIRFIKTKDQGLGAEIIRHELPI